LFEIGNPGDLFDRQMNVEPSSNWIACCNPRDQCQLIRDEIGCRERILRRKSRGDGSRRNDGDRDVSDDDAVDPNGFFNDFPPVDRLQWQSFCFALKT
jgi:hypothetical protein